MNKKNLIIILVLIVIAVLSGFWYMRNKEEQIAVQNLDQNQQNDKKEADNNNKVYKNDKYGFSFQYPIDWEIIEKDDSVYVFHPGKEYSIENSQIYPISLSFNFENYAGKKTLDEWRKGIESIGLGEKKFEELIISGKKSVRVKYYMGTDTLILYDESKNYQIFISMNHFENSEIDSEDLIVYNNILKTINFE